MPSVWEFGGIRLIPIVIVDIIKYLAIGIAAIAGFGVMNNIIGAATGRSPMAQATTSLVESLVPMMVTLMPAMFVMNMFMGIMNSIFAPIQRAVMPAVAPPISMVY